MENLAQVSMNNSGDAQEAAVKERDCLMCGGAFISEGPQNRICPRCKNSQAWRTG